MEEWVFLFDLLYSYLEQCHKTWEVLQKLQGRANYPECSHKFVDTVAPAIHRYAVQLCKLALKQQERDGQSFIIRRWVSETRSIVEEFQVPINKLNLVEVKGGINLVGRSLGVFLCEVPMWCSGCSVWRALGAAKKVTRVP